MTEKWKMNYDYSQSRRCLSNQNPAGNGRHVCWDFKENLINKGFIPGPGNGRKCLVTSPGLKGPAEGAGLLVSDESWNGVFHKRGASTSKGLPQKRGLAQKGAYVIRGFPQKGHSHRRGTPIGRGFHTEGNSHGTGACTEERFTQWRAAQEGLPQSVKGIAMQPLTCDTTKRERQGRSNPTSLSSSL